ncbi:hypothetical protein GCM10008022_36310 [Paenibacillus hunanensis]|nr:hypothetical protein GCM10008022_36310 [Paenibacillus hunanensis]
MVWDAATAQARNKGTDSGGAAGIFWIRKECRFLPLQSGKIFCFAKITFH